MAIAFAISRPFTTSAIIGATSMEQLKANIGAGTVTLAPEVLEDIAQLYLTMPDPTV
jgi:aryl-alcohol dehydrogenase-like predicted oxidoreductase